MPIFSTESSFDDFLKSSKTQNTTIGLYQLWVLHSTPFFDATILTRKSNHSGEYLCQPHTIQQSDDLSSTHVLRLSRRNVSFTNF
jgi:hypothetical protein